MTSTLVHPVAFEGADCLVAGLDFIGWSRYGEAIPFGLSSHTHDAAYELCFLKRGSSDWWASEDTYRIQPGDIFLTKPHELHGGIDDTMQPCELFWALFRLNTPEPPFGLSKTLTAELDGMLRLPSSRQAKASECIQRHFLRILETLRRQDRFAKAIVNATMQLLLVDAVRAFHTPESTPGTQSEYSERVRKTVDWIKSDIGDAPSVGEMAEHAGLGPSQFRDVFRAETGFSPIEFLNNHRVRRAKELLAETDSSITDIAIEVGFQSSQYFATCFKRFTGTSPHNYRKSSRENR